MLTGTYLLHAPTPWPSRLLSYGAWGSPPMALAWERGNWPLPPQPPNFFFIALKVTLEMEG